LALTQALYSGLGLELVQRPVLFWLGRGGIVVGGGVVVVFITSRDAWEWFCVRRRLEER
jgi:hypothetical protein